MRRRELTLAMLLLAAGAFTACRQGAAPDTRTEIQYLSGKDAATAVPWDFLCSGGRQAGVWGRIDVPSCWELQGYGTYQYGVLLRGSDGLPPADETGLYRTCFRVPETWKDRVVELVFEGVMTDCSVELNGQTAVALHQGSYYRFSADVSKLLRYDGQDNQLEVLVSKESADRSVNEAERRADFWNFGGIFRPVFLTARPRQHIGQVAVDAQADGRLKARLQVDGTDDDGDYRIVARLSDLDGRRIGRPASFPVESGQSLIETQYGRIQAWTAETPALYRLDLQLFDGRRLLHSCSERIGFRTIEVREEDGLYINGRKVLVKGANRHSFRPETGRALSRQDNIDDVRLMREMNMNAVRLSHYPPDPDFLDICDSLGLYVMDELAGWHGHYSTEVGTPLVEAMVARDQNHPSVIWWSNGNEGGFNYELEPVFKQSDLQQRPVLYPWSNRNGFETQHYPLYARMKMALTRPGIYMPTEFLHGLYDGGHGAALWDYWEQIRLHERAGGGFLWSLADEGVLRTDENGRIDCVGNYAPDGIVGPHHEKEGSFDAIRQIWCPVHVQPAGAAAPADESLALQADQCSFIADLAAFNGRFLVENRYDFINLKDCAFAWELVKFRLPRDRQGGHRLFTGGQASGRVAGCNLPPRQSGQIDLPLPDNWQQADALYLTAFNPQGDSLFTWSYYWREPEPLITEPTDPSAAAPACRVEGNILRVCWKDDDPAGDLLFDITTGHLLRLGRFTLGNGPRFVAANRVYPEKRNNPNWMQDRPKERTYENVAPDSRLTSFTWSDDLGMLLVKAAYEGPIRSMQWLINRLGEIQLDYEYLWEEPVELCGICFDYPEEQMQGLRMLAKGPYRVWQNRLHGPRLDVWGKAWNDPVPGESFDYPEFKGYYADWQWAAFQTTEGRLIWQNGRSGSYLGLYTPRDGRDGLVFTLPSTGLAVLDVIPAIGNKGHAPDMTGPSGRKRQLQGPQKGRLMISLE